MRIIQAILLIFLSVSVYSQNGDLRVEIERIILHDTEISLDETPGFLIGIVDQDSTYYVDFGVKSLGSDERLDMNDIFEVGSVSKVFAASLVSVMTSKGIVSYEDKINQYLPLDLQNPRMDDVTILDLVQHTSGLPVRPHFFGIKERDPQNPYGYYEKKDLLEFYTEFVPKSIGEFNYSHTNYGLLEIILEQATGESFDLLMDQHMIDPMGLDSTFVFFKERKQDVLTPGYDRAGRQVSPWSFASFGASEGVKTTALDLMKFMKINIGLGSHPYNDVFKINHNKEVDTNFNESIMTGRGWQIINQRKRYDIITHTGRTNGHNVSMAFIKETGTGVFILSNSNVGTRDLGFLILRMINFNWKRKA